MKDEELDALIARRMQIHMSERHLSPEFTERLIRSIRSRERGLRLKVISVLTVLSLLMYALFACLAQKPRESDDGSRQIVGQSSGPTEQISGWMFLGLFRECFRRGRTGKKKEESNEEGKEGDVTDGR